MQVRPVPYEHARPLVDALSSELTRRYGGGPASVAHPEEFVPPYGVFLVVTLHGEDVACGGVRPLSEGIGEIKRMYVEPAARGQGLSRLLLRELVAFGRRVAYRELWLETGVEQPEAIGLYESEGFVPITRYGQYKDEPRSRCYTLLLASARRDS